MSAVRFPKRGMLPGPEDIDAKFQTHHDPYAPDSMWFVPWLAGATVIARVVGLIVFLVLN
ncbi:MAG: hypothetical protein WBW37_03215 [Methyloceanibacter sp.]